MPRLWAWVGVVGVVAWAPVGAQPVPRPQVAMPVVVHPARAEGARARRAEDGHFYFRTEVNGAALRMLFDSGAGLVVLRYEDAAAAGVDVGALRFNVPTTTANGPAMSAAVVIRELTVGGITKTDVRGIVARPGVLAFNLLGQSFLARLGGLRQEGDVLVLLDGG